MSFSTYGSDLGYGPRNITDAVRQVTGGTVTLKAGDIGTVINVGANTSGVTTYDLPGAPTAALQGWNISFVATGVNDFVIGNGDLLMQGGLFHNNNSTTLALIQITNRTSITLTSSTIGDNINIVCDGTNYIVTGNVNGVPTLG